VEVNKIFRHGQILKIIRNQSIRTQEELSQALARIGVQVTQVTLSRDIHKLGLVKGPQGYAEPAHATVQAGNDGAALKHVITEFVLDVHRAQNLVIIKTAPGNAAPIAYALDKELGRQNLGTIAGEDTVFAATADSKTARKLHEKLLDMLR
jgi:transcriptional regulator of arginine metabolism